MGLILILHIKKSYLFYDYKLFGQILGGLAMVSKKSIEYYKKKKKCQSTADKIKMMV